MKTGMLTYDEQVEAVRIAANKVVDETIDMIEYCANETLPGDIPWDAYEEDNLLGMTRCGKLYLYREFARILLRVRRGESLMWETADELMRQYHPSMFDADLVQALVPMCVSCAMSRRGWDLFYAEWAYDPALVPGQWSVTYDDLYPIFGGAA